MIGLSHKITHKAMKIAVTPEYEDEKKTLSPQQVTFVFVAVVLSDIFFFNFGGYASECNCANFSYLATKIIKSYVNFNDF